MQLRIDLRNGKALLPVEGDMIAFHTPTKLTVTKRSEDHIIFEVEKLQQFKPGDLAAIFTSISSGFF